MKCSSTRTCRPVWSKAWPRPTPAPPMSAKSVCTPQMMRPSGPARGTEVRHRLERRRLPPAKLRAGRSTEGRVDPPGELLTAEIQALLVGHHAKLPRLSARAHAPRPGPARAYGTLAPRVHCRTGAEHFPETEDHARTFHPPITRKYREELLTGPARSCSRSTLAHHDGAVVVHSPSLIRRTVSG